MLTAYIYFRDLDPKACEGLSACPGCSSPSSNDHDPERISRHRQGLNGWMDGEMGGWRDGLKLTDSVIVTKVVNDGAKRRVRGKCGLRTTDTFLKIILNRRI
ncbi:hypothetical protein ATANTOWER_019329 [Ataeniobius toweri]|uniref:Uncharacterized protein n=1 Tax=Ataeniobius toweri TaxID=208326 RepID=A0ABU7B7H9_9TELE|nr:hypothetical protein [Ataeniobius toweri]